MIEATTFELLGAALFEVTGPQLAINRALSQQMVSDVQDMATDHKGGMLAAGADYHAAVDGRRRGVARVPSRLTALDQDGAQPALAALGAAAFTGTLVVTGRYPGPTRQMRAIGKAAHVGADLDKIAVAARRLTPGMVLSCSIFFTDRTFYRELNRLMK